MSKFTPGPWKEAGYILYDGNGQVWYSVHAAKRGQIIRCKRQEDAKAVQALPDLLEALQTLMKNFPTDFDLTEAGWDASDIETAMLSHDQAAAAIKKATQ